MGNVKSINLLPFKDPKKTISFGGVLEEEMIQKFTGSTIVCMLLKNLKNLKNGKLFQM